MAAGSSNQCPLPPPSFSLSPVPLPELLVTWSGFSPAALFGGPRVSSTPPPQHSVSSACAEQGQGTGAERHHSTLPLRSPCLGKAEVKAVWPLPQPCHQVSQLRAHCPALSAVSSLTST